MTQFQIEHRLVDGKNTYGIRNKCFNGLQYIGPANSKLHSNIVSYSSFTPWVIHQEAGMESNIHR
jgi:hypothetical protein